jgi:hypothetical protein
VFQAGFDAVLFGGWRKNFSINFVLAVNFVTIKGGEQMWPEGRKKA